MGDTQHEESKYQLSTSEMGCVYVGGVGRGIRDSDSKAEGGARDTKNATRVLQGLISQVRVTNAR